MDSMLENNIVSVLNATHYVAMQNVLVIRRYTQKLLGGSDITSATLLFIYYVYFWLCWVFVFLCEGFLQLRRVGATLRRGARASHYRGLSCCGAEVPDAQAQ